MRTVIVPTDFSNPSKNAARYALNIAIGLKADLHLCHAYSTPAESPVIGEVPWILQDFPEVKADAEKALKKLAKALETIQKFDSFINHIFHKMDTLENNRC